MSGANQIVLGSVTVGPAPSSAEDAMAASIVHLLKELEETRNERDFYKAVAGKLAKGGRKK